MSSVSSTHSGSCIPFFDVSLCSFQAISADMSQQFLVCGSWHTVSIWVARANLDCHQEFLSVWCAVNFLELDFVTVNVYFPAWLVNPRSLNLVRILGVQVQDDIAYFYWARNKLDSFCVEAKSHCWDW